MTDDLIGRAEAQTAIQFAAKRYTVAHEAHGEGQVVWSDNLINVTDAMNVLRDLPSAEPDTTTHDSIPVETGKNDGDRTSGDCISRQQAIDALLGITAMRNTIPLDSAIFNIKKLPSAQPEPRTAYWTKDIVGSVVCSNCGGIREDNRIGHTQWCNCCGCFMRGE